MRGSNPCLTRSVQSLCSLLPLSQAPTSRHKTARSPYSRPYTKRQIDSPHQAKPKAACLQNWLKEREREGESEERKGEEKGKFACRSQTDLWSCARPGLRNVRAALSLSERETGAAGIPHSLASWLRWISLSPMKFWGSIFPNGNMYFTIEVTC